jgi:transcriptional regulator with XRE-family HTH domain
MKKRFDFFKITLRAARVNRGLTRNEVAVITKKSVDTICKYECDSSNVPRDLLIQLIDIYQIPDEHIFFGKESSFHGLVPKKSTRKLNKKSG